MKHIKIKTRCFFFRMFGSDFFKPLELLRGKDPCAQDIRQKYALLHTIPRQIPLLPNYIGI